MGIGVVKAAGVLYVLLLLIAVSSALLHLFNQAAYAVPFYLLGDLFLFCVLLWSACSFYAVPFYRMLGEMCVALFV